jgi:hypothetical protein
MIVILGSSKWTPISTNDSHTIADDSLWGLEWTFGTNLLHRQWDKPGESRMKIPSVDLRAFYFQRAAPSFSRESKLVESISDWDEVKYGMKWNPLKRSCLRNGVVWGSSLIYSPFFVMPQYQCPHCWLETWMNGNPSGSVVVMVIISTWVDRKHFLFLYFI